MPFALKLLNSTSVNSTATNLVIYKVGLTKDLAAKAAIVSNIRIYNFGAGAATVTISVKGIR